MVVRIESLARIGDNVFSVNHENRYVMKVVPIRSKTDRLAFETEIAVGETNGIERFGVRTHAWYRHGGYGVILMDHVEMGRKNVKSVTAEQYLQSFPGRKAVFVKKLKRCLTGFYNLTKRFHGDLHLDNVMVVLSKEGNINTQSIKIIDYGSTVPIDHTTGGSNGHKTYAEWARLIRKTFDSKPNDKKQRYHPIGSGVRVKHDRSTGVPFRANKNVLNYYNIRT